MISFVRFNVEHPEFFRMFIFESHTRSDRSRHLATHLSRGLAVFRDRPVDDDGPMSVKRVMAMLQLMGAAGTLYATSSVLPLELEECIEASEAKEQFAQRVTAMFLSPSELYEFGTAG